MSVSPVPDPEEESAARPDLWEAVQEPLPGMPDAKMPGRIYYALDANRLYVKVGFTQRSPHRRGGELKSEIIVSEPGTKLDEKRLHRRYANRRIGGEWFLPDDQMITDMFYLAGRQRDVRAFKILRRMMRDSRWRPAA